MSGDSVRIDVMNAARVAQAAAAMPTRAAYWRVRDEARADGAAPETPSKGA